MSYNPLCALWYIYMYVQDLQVFQLRHHGWHHSRRMADWLQCFPQGSLSFPHHNLDHRNVFITISSDLFVKDSKTALLFHSRLVCSSLFLHYLTGLRCFSKQTVPARPLCNTIFKFQFRNLTSLMHSNIWRWHIGANQILLWHLRPQQRWLHIEERFDFIFAFFFNSV